MMVTSGIQNKFIFKVFSVGSKVFRRAVYWIFLVTILHFWVNIVNFKNLRSNAYYLRSEVLKPLDPTIFYFISNASFLTILDFNIFDIDLIVYYASFEMLHTEVRFLQSNNLSFNLKVIIIWVSSTIVQYNTILTEKVQIYFEVMINYIIALTLHTRRSNVRSFSSYQLPFSQMILWPSWIHIGLTLCSLLHSNPLHQAGCVWFALSSV